MTLSSSQLNKFQIDLEPVGRRIEVGAGTTLLEAVQAAGVELISICGGVGSCGTCRVRLINGRLSALTLVEEAELNAEELASGFRLACQCTPLADVRVDIPPESLTTPQRLQVEGLSMEIELDPPVIPLDIRLSPPDLHDLRSDAIRLQDALKKVGHKPYRIGYHVLTSLSDRLRALDWSARLAVRGDEIVAILPLGSRLMGLAVDVGTTKLAAYLVDLTTGETLGKAGAMNPQIAYGEDVVSRIAYTNDHLDGRKTLQSRLVETLNQMLAELCQQAGGTCEQVVEAVIVGNTAMHHLFAGLPVHQLGMAPYVPATSEALEFPIREVGLNMAPGAYVYLPPNIAGYVGADHIAMLLAMDVAQSNQTTIALDIGTNTEISLATGGRLLSCSCASGPAFEGAHIQDGMRAAPGAIERVKIEEDGVRTHTIGNQPAVGICGSGILDAVAEMLKAGVLDERGVLTKADPRIQLRNGKTGFVLAPAASSGNGRDVVVTRQDVHEIQLAKGAIYSGVQILLLEAGLTDIDIQDFIVAGAFGTYLDLDSAVRVGMFPKLPHERFRQVGNAAGMGAKQMLISAKRREEATQIMQRVKYVELTTHPKFTDQFVKALLFNKP